MHSTAQGLSNLNWRCLRAAASLVIPVTPRASWASEKEALEKLHLADLSPSSVTRQGLTLSCMRANKSFKPNPLRGSA
jgi:hypothetical protein